MTLVQLQKRISSIFSTRGRRALWFFCFVIPVIFFSACRETETNTKQHDFPVTIIAPVISNHTAQTSFALLREIYPHARIANAKNLTHEITQCLRDDRVLLIPDITRFPMDWWKPLRSYMNHGGAVVFIGRNPFAERVKFVEGKPWTEAQRVAGLIKQAKPVDGVSSLSGWQHVNNSGEITGRVRLADVPVPKWHGISVEVSAFDDWDMMILPDISRGSIPSHFNEMTFYSRGGKKTSRIVIECEEFDGSHWYYPLSLTHMWTPHALHEGAFIYSHGGVNRGGHKDGLSFSRIKKIAVGLSNRLASQFPGDHLFEISDIRFTTSSDSPDEVISWPDIALLSPPFRYYNIQASAVQSKQLNHRFDLGFSAMQSPFPQSRGQGGEQGTPYRWIPLYCALNKKGACPGWPVSLYIQPLDNGTVQRWGWIALDPSKGTHDVTAVMINECVERLQAGVFLYKAGFEQFTFNGNTNLVLTVRCAQTPNSKRNLRIAAELWRADESSPRRRVVANLLKEKPTQINLGMSPRIESQPEDYTLRIILEGSRANGKTYDQIEQELKFLPSSYTSGSDGASRRGPRFAYQGRPLFPLGLNYQPLSTSGKLPTEWNPYWLNPGVFDPVLINRDLNLLQEAGINIVSIQYTEENQAPQLRYFIEEAQKRRIWVHLFIPHLNPIHPDLNAAKKLFDTAGLAQKHSIFALDIAWEPHLGTYADRCVLDPQWRAWLIEQYGSFDHAEQVLKTSLWRNEGIITGPPDKELIYDGEYRKRVAVYRRFVDDFISRRYGWIIRSLRRWGCPQMVSARTGYGGTGNAWGNPFFALDPASGAVHLDFISPEGWGLKGPHEKFMEAGFITAYCRGISGGKPVLWAEFGNSVGSNPRNIDLENQARVYSNMFEMILKSRASGALGWWYPGGYRVDEQSDMGVVNPDGSWRPVGKIYRGIHRQIRKADKNPEPWRAREIDRFADARGLSGLWDKWKKTYRQEMEQGKIQELRPRYFGKRSSETPLLSVGNVPFQDPAPMAYLNAEWGVVEIDEKQIIRGMDNEKPVQAHLKQRLHMELINTGPVTWDTSEKDKTRTVWVELTDPRGGQLLLPVPPLAFGDHTRITWIASDSGQWKIRPFLSGVGAFGQPLKIEVLP